MSDFDTTDDDRRRPDDAGTDHSSDVEEPRTERERAEERGTPFTQQLGRVFVAIIAVLFGIFAVYNAQFVDFNWVFGETLVVQEGGERVSGGVPLIILLVASFVLGGLATWFATWRRGRHRDGS